METEPTSEVMQELMSFYNKAIEYYSAVGSKTDSQNSFYEKYL